MRSPGGAAASGGWIPGHIEASFGRLSMSESRSEGLQLAGEMELRLAGGESAGSPRWIFRMGNLD